MSHFVRDDRRERQPRVVRKLAVATSITTRFLSWIDSRVSPATSFDKPGLREVLLPFVAGMVLAYLLNPLASRIERLGISRLLATLVIIALVIVVITVLMILTVPTIIHELSYFIESFPLYIRRLHTLATDPSRPWLSKIIGEGLGEAERSIGELTNLAGDWFGTFLRSAWSGGRALISLLSLGVVAPIVACYLLYDWDRMIAAIDNWGSTCAARESAGACARGR